MHSSKQDAEFMSASLLHIRNKRAINPEAMTVDGFLFVIAAVFAVIVFVCISFCLWTLLTSVRTRANLVHSAQASHRSSVRSKQSTKKVVKSDDNETWRTTGVANEQENGSIGSTGFKSADGRIYIIPL